MKIILMILIAANLLSAEDLYQISRKTINEKEISIPKPVLENAQDLANQAYNFAFQIIEEGQNIIKDLTISNPRRELTIMVYINAKSDLEDEGLINVNDMERIGSTKDVNIIVEFGRMNGQEGDTHADGDWVGIKRYYIKKDSDIHKINSVVVYSKIGPKRYDMGDFKKVIDFVKWTKNKFPANRYILILWNHGTGWLDPQKRKVSRGISFDWETGNYITTEEIGNIVRSVGGVDILAFDACLMQTAEVLAEVKDYTKVVIGSEEVVPGYGYPYALFLDAIVKNPNMSDEEIAATVVKAFKTFYSYVEIPATLSAIRSDKIKGLFDRMREFSKAAMEADEIEAVKKARKNVIRYDIFDKVDPDKTISFFGDLSDFARIVSENISRHDERSKILKSKANQLISYIDRELVIARESFGAEKTGKPLSLSKGVSVYIPPVMTSITYERIDSTFNHPYSDFRFAKESGWDVFVRFVYEKAK